MKSTILFIGIPALAFFAAIAVADVPQMINYQGRLTDPGGAALDTTVSMEFTIYDDSTGGVPQWTEVHSAVSVTGGLFDVILGAITPMDDNVFSNSNRWLGITVGVDPEITPRTKLITVPYTFRVSTVDRATGGLIIGDVSILSDERAPGDLSVSGKATIGPGQTNTGSNSFVAGMSNSATGPYNTVTGVNNTTSGNNAAVGGGSGNIAAGSNNTIGGGADNSTSGSSATIGGGWDNEASNTDAVIAGGARNSATGHQSAILGGESNLATGSNASIGGGGENTAAGSSSTIGGGSGNSASNEGATVGGGILNSASGTYGATVSGGSNNGANEWGATVGGGDYNIASGIDATVGGGHGNEAQGAFSVVCGGGGANTSDGNVAGGESSAVGGGRNNSAEGNYSVIVGGAANTVTASATASMAFGDGVYINDGLRVIFFDGITSGRLGLNRDHFDGGISHPIHVGTDGTNGNGAHLTAGGVWTDASSRQKKEAFQPLAGEALLNKVASIPVESWQYRGTDERHIGPVAEDFVAAFDVGTINDDGTRNNQYLSQSDVAGVALAGVKELITKNQELEAEIAELKALVRQLLDRNK